MKFVISFCYRKNKNAKFYGITNKNWNFPIIEKIENIFLLEN